MTISAQPADEMMPLYFQQPGAFVRHYIRARASLFVFLFCSAAAAASAAVVIQYVMKMLVDAISGPPSGAPWWILGLFIALIATESALWRMTGVLGCRVTVGVGVDMRADLFAYLAGQPTRYFADNFAGSLGQRVTSTAGNFGSLVNTAVWRILPSCVDFIGAMIVFYTLDWRMMLALACFVIAVTAGLIAFGKRGRPLHTAYARVANTVGGDLIDVISNLWLLKSFSAANSEAARLRGEFEQEARAQQRSWMYTEWSRVVHDVALCIMAATMLSWCIYLWSTRAITSGDVVLVSALTFRILHGSRDAALALVDLSQNFAFIQETLRVIAKPQTLTDRAGARPLRCSSGSIELRNVCFGYEGGRDALHDISLFIPAGQKVGIAGVSGAGKSTLVHLIQRLSDPQSGSILIDGQLISHVTQDSLRQALAVVPQETTLLHRSVSENILIARPSATMDELRQAAGAAQCEGFLRNLPQGYDTYIGERGTKLSGGQRQRVGIARAFLKDSPIVIFDEATSALDTESEMKIHQALLAMKSRTVVAVAHRLSTLIAFDRVIVIQGGRLVEDGSPDALLASGKVFSRMWEGQAKALKQARQLSTAW